jgi:molybdopterin-guanine dinucleotide biosynthesis protein A
LSVRALAGIFVGGEARRMDGRAKGLLRLASGEAIVDRWARHFAELGVPSVLVGSRPEYAPREAIEDVSAGSGPLGGLVALLRHAAGPAEVIAVGCDMPHVSPVLLRRLLEAPWAPVVAPCRAGVWEPLFARYDTRLCLPRAEARLLAGERSMQALLRELGATPLAISETEGAELDDWDTMEEMSRRPA